MEIYVFSSICLSLFPGGMPWLVLLCHTPVQCQDPLEPAEYRLKSLHSVIKITFYSFKFLSIVSAMKEVTKIGSNSICPTYGTFEYYLYI